MREELSPWKESQGVSMEQKLPVDIMQTPQMATYLVARQSVREDIALTELLSTYKTSAVKLVSMIQSGSFDPQTIIALSDDTDRMRDELEQNEKLIALEIARVEVQKMLESGEAVYTASCTGNCATCNGCNSCAETKKED